MTHDEMMPYIEQTIAVAKDALAVNDLVTFIAAVQLAAELLQLARLWRGEE